MLFIILLLLYSSW